MCIDETAEVCQQHLAVLRRYVNSARCTLSCVEIREVLGPKMLQQLAATPHIMPEAWQNLILKKNAVVAHICLALAFAQEAVILLPDALERAEAYQAD